MEFFRVKNYDKYQQFKRERPPWIKFYCSTLRDPTIADLSLKARAVYFELLLLAAELQNKIPLSTTYIQQSLFIPKNESLQPLLDELFKTGFLIAETSVSVSVSVSVSESELKNLHAKQLLDCVTTLKTKKKTAFPEEWSVEPWMEELCAGLGLNSVSEFTQFKNHHMSKGTVFLSWPHAFRTWVANSVKFNRRDNTTTTHLNTDPVTGRYRPTRVVL
jgi:hypothetical protein